MSMPMKSPRCRQRVLPVGRHDFETVSSRTVFHGNIIALRTDEVRMPGGLIATRDVVEHYGAVAVAAIDDNEQLIMIHQYRHPVGRRLWELPAGLLDEPGEDPLTAAQRELREEAGLVARDWRVLVDVITAPGFCDESVRVYLARGLDHVGRPEADHEEADLTVHRVGLRRAADQVLAGEIINSIAAAGVLAAYAAVVDGKPTRGVEAPWPERSRAFAARQGHV
jgi:8-oxo-dGTP pyrophosphatase MutT (NUDIX family)